MNEYVGKEFRQIEWDAAVEDNCRQIVRLAVREDLGRLFDWTTVCLVPSDTQAQATVVARHSGVVCGLRAAQLALAEIDSRVVWSAQVADGASISAGQTLANISGPARSLLVAERILLNLIGRLSGIATLTPHVASRTYESVERQATMAAENLIRVLNGQAPHAQANKL